MSGDAFKIEAGRMTLSGALTAVTVGAVWRPALAEAARMRAQGEALVIDVSASEKIDTAGVSFLLALERAHDQAKLEGLNPQAAALAARLRPSLTTDPTPLKPSRPPMTDPLHGLIDRIAFLGETIAAAVALPLRRRLLRVADFYRIADLAGVQAVPLIVMLGFLIGMILAFQSAVPMRQFGADLFVADLVAISLFRELGPLLCAVILAGRTGSAFAAELGTMQVNEEIAALRTMGIDPATMLVLPRMAATVLIMPGLTIAMDLAGLVGMGFVLVLFGFPPSAIAAHVANAAKVGGFLLGLFKAMIFGGTIALIGCRAGLNAGLGPRAVGEAATSAVVGGIVSTILLDGIFAVFIYRLGL